MTCFRLKATPTNQDQEKLNRRFIEKLAEWDKIFIGGASVGSEYFIRITFNYSHNKELLSAAWNKMVQVADDILKC